MNKKNILIINGYLDIGGAERVLTYLANILCEEYKVTFAILRVSKNNLFKLDNRVELIQLNLENERKSSKEMGLYGLISYFSNTAKVIRRLVNNLNSDLVIAFNDREIFLTWWALHNNKKIKLLFSQRNSPSSKLIRTNMLLKYIYHHCDGVVFQLSQVENFYGMKNNKRSIIIENPVPLEEIIIPNKRKNKILAAGRLTEQKRFDLLIEAFSYFQNDYQNYYLEIYGSGEKKQDLINLIEEKNLKDKIKLLDPIPNVMMNNNDAKMFVLSSDYEGIPNILIEAMAAGIPCISTNCTPGGGDLVTNHGKCGILIECNNVSQLVNAMKQYADSKDLRDNNVNKARKYINRFSEKNISLKWINFIKNIIE